MDIKTVVTRALESAQFESEMIAEEGERNRARSTRFVRFLAAELLKAHEGCADRIAATTKHDPTNRPLFGMNELLFDITVVQFDMVNSGDSNKDLVHVTRGLWIVESEMARNKREALFDFNKLVLGSADNKLFVGPHVGDEQDYLRVLEHAAKYCNGTLFVALIPHPDRWPVSAADAVSAWVWRWCRWEPIA